MDIIDASSIDFEYDGKYIGTAILSTDPDVVTNLSSLKFHHELSILNPTLFRKGKTFGTTFESLSTIVDNGIFHKKANTHDSWKSLSNEKRSKIISKSSIGNDFEFTQKDWFNHLEYQCLV